MTPAEMFANIQAELEADETMTTGTEIQKVAMKDEQLALPMDDVRPPMCEIIQDSQQWSQRLRLLRVMPKPMVTRRINSLRNQELPKELHLHLWRMSRGYSKLTHHDLWRLAFNMEWEIEHFEETGRLTVDGG